MKFIDLFSVIGGMRLGLEQAGHECVGFCEFDRFARQSYKAMYNTEGEWESLRQSRRCLAIGAVILDGLYFARVLENRRNAKRIFARTARN